MADLHAARDLDGSGSVGREVAVAHLADLDDPVRAVLPRGGEVPAGDEAEDVAPVLVRPRDPRGARDDARVEHVADAGRRRLAEHGPPLTPRPDVALDEPGVTGEVRLRRRLDRGRRERDLGALEVDLAVAGQADDDERARPPSPAARSPRP